MSSMLLSLLSSIPSTITKNQWKKYPLIGTKKKASYNIPWRWKTKERAEAYVLLTVPQCERECVHLRPCLNKVIFITLPSHL